MSRDTRKLVGNLFHNALHQLLLGHLFICEMAEAESLASFERFVFLYPINALFHCHGSATTFDLPHHRISQNSRSHNAHCHISSRQVSMSAIDPI
jgi:hypothetical protein